ncbi:MAG: HDOD domain-containing protein [Helicobacter sp.]|uniref:HDOD domain-containing protein n=1 Tax=Helicobacter sp. TaxID=218 RepID=UPI002A814761|nr:HDOD domain-containing protein [Helicobacter sp.]MDY4426669.1 HDOD domain-containing protein [Helicobacter sp.]
MKDLIISEIDSLPPLPQTISELQKACLREDVSIREIANIIESDPLLTANIIKTANSPLFGYSRTINSVSQAVMLFGVYTAKGLAIASAIKSQLEMDLSPYGLSVADFIKASNLKGIFLAKWHQSKNPILHSLISCALIIHVGMVILANVLRSTNKEKDFEKKLKSMSLIEAERSVLQMDQIEILEMLFEHWHFEETMVQIVHYLGKPELPKELECYIYPLRVVNFLINPYSIASKEQIQEALKYVSLYGLDEEGFNRALLEMGFVENLSEIE